MHSVGTGEGGDVLHVAQRLVVHRTVVNLDLQSGGALIPAGVPRNQC